MFRSDGNGYCVIQDIIMARIDVQKTDIFPILRFQL